MRHNLCLFLVRIRRFLLALDTTDILCLVNSNFCENKRVIKFRKSTLSDVMSSM